MSETGKPRARGWMKRSITGITALVVIASMQTMAAAGEPTGFGKAKFKMTSAEVKKVFPKMEVLEKPLAAAVVGGSYATRFVLWDYAMPGLKKPVDVELRFWSDRLWVIIVYFKENDTESVVEALRKEVGSPGNGDANFLTWIGDTSTTVLTRRDQYYSISDNDLSAEARAAIFKGMGEHVPAAKQPGGGGVPALTKGSSESGSSAVPSAAAPPKPE